MEQYALISASLLLDWIRSADDGFPDEVLLDDAVTYAKLAMRHHDAQELTP